MDTIKFLILTQGVEDMVGMKAGLELAKQRAASIGLNISFDFVETVKQYTGTTFENTTVGKGACIKPEEIAPEVLAAQIKNGKKYNIGCIIFDWDKISPRPTNPVQNGVLFDKFTIIQIPVQWYSDFTVTPHKTYSEVLSQFFLHELSHAMYFFANYANPQGSANLVDETHNQYKYTDPATPNIAWNNQQPDQYYLHLLSNLRKYWYLAQQGASAPVPTVPPLPAQRTLKYGMSGADVHQLQADLETLKYFVYPMKTTYFGTVTLGAVKALQGANGLTVDGIVGAKTFAKIAELLKKKPSSGSLIVKWATAIQKHEGFFAGSRSYRNNNPANFKVGAKLTDFMRSLGAVGVDSGGFAVFPDYATGFAALCRFLDLACSNQLISYRNTMTLKQFFAVYAPSSDNNDPDAYARAVAVDIGVSADTQIVALK